MIARRLYNWPTMGRHNPFAEMERVTRDMNRLLDAFGGRRGLPFGTAKVFPAVNITEDKNNFFVRAELPGINANDIDLQMNARNLVISGERKIPSEGESAKYHRREREAGKFSRAVGLPGDVDADKIEAKMVNGVLTVRLPKSEAAKPKQIRVR